MYHFLDLAGRAILTNTSSRSQIPLPAFIYVWARAHSKKTTYLREKNTVNQNGRLQSLMCSTNSFPGSPLFGQKCTPSSLPSSKILPQDYWTLLGKHKKSWDPRGPMIWDNFSIFRANCAILTSYIYACVVVSRVDVVTLRDQILRIASFSCGFFTAVAGNKELGLFYVLLCS